METENEKIEMDLCVECGKPTEYPTIMDVELRDHYIEGAGQLCDDCYNKIYGKK